MDLGARTAGARPAPVDPAALDAHPPGLGAADAPVVDTARAGAGAAARALFEPTLHGRLRRPLGRASCAVVGPFSRRIVPGMLERAARRGRTSGG